MIDVSLQRKDSATNTDLSCPSPREEELESRVKDLEAVLLEKDGFIAQLETQLFHFREAEW